MILYTLGSASLETATATAAADAAAPTAEVAGTDV